MSFSESWRPTATGENMDELVWMPCAFLQIWAGLKNQSPRAVVSNEELIRLTLYIIRYHFGAERGQVSLNMVHGTANTNTSSTY